MSECSFRQYTYIDIDHSQSISHVHSSKVDNMRILPEEKQDISRLEKMIENDKDDEVRYVV